MGIYVALGILSGFSIVLSRIVNAGLGIKMGIYQSVFYNYIVGLFSVTLVLFVSGDFKLIQAISPNQIPIIGLFGGLLGVAVVSISNYVTPKVSNFKLTIIIFVSQILTGILLDFILTQEITMGKVIGGGLVVIGLYFNSK